MKTLRELAGFGVDSGTKGLLASGRLWLPILWLVANCFVVTFSVELMPLLVCVVFPGMAVWMAAGVLLLWLALSHGPGWRRPVGTWLVVLGGVVALTVPWSGDCMWVLAQQRFLLNQIHAAFAHPGMAPTCGPGWIEVDRSDDPPVRAAVFRFAAHGDVIGVIYDPTGVALNREHTERWLWGAHARHLFGDWYSFAN